MTSSVITHVSTDRPSGLTIGISYTTTADAAGFPAPYVSYIWATTNPTESAADVAVNGREGIVSAITAPNQTLSEKGLPEGTNYVHIVEKEVSTGDLSNVLDVTAVGMNTPPLETNVYANMLANPVSSALDLSKVAIVYDPLNQDSIDAADYYIKRRKLNPGLKYAVTLQAGGDSQSGWAYLEAVAFADWATPKGVQAVILSCGFTSRLNGTHGTIPDSTLSNDANGWILSTPALFGLAKLIKSYGYIPVNWRANTVDTISSPNVRIPLSKTLTQLEAMALVPFVWHDGNSYPSSVEPFNSPVNTPYVGDRVANLSTQKIIPFGRIGATPSAQWDDNFTNTKRCIDDALIAEAHGREYNLGRQFVGLHSYRTTYLGAYSGITTGLLDKLGYNAVGGEIWDNGTSNVGLVPWLYNGQSDSDTTATIYARHSVPSSSFTSSELTLGTITPKLKAFWTYGEALANVVSDTWTDGFEFQTGAVHYIATSLPSPTLWSALAHGACAGIAGNIEPLEDNVTFIPSTNYGLLSGQSLLEAHFRSQQKNISAYSYPTGEPLYAMFTPEAPMDTLLNTFTIVTAGGTPSLIAYVSPTTGSILPLPAVITGIAEVGLIGNKAFSGVFSLLSMVDVVPEEYWDYMTVEATVGTAFSATLDRVDDFSYMEVGGPASEWSLIAGGLGLTIGDTYEVKLWKAAAPSDTPTLTSPYANQLLLLNDTVSLNVSTNWSGVVSNSFTAQGLPPGLSISATGTITGDIKFGGIIGTTIKCIGNDGAEHQAGLNWYVNYFG